MLDQYRLFDSHFHVIDKRFALQANNGYLPDEFTQDEYLKKTSAYNLQGGAIVSGSFQAFDQTYMLHALKTLGPSFIGVTQLPHDVSDREIIALNSAGVRAIRFNLKRGGSEGIKHLSHMAHRVYDLAQWHVELYVDSDILAELSDELLRLPAVCIDHLGLNITGLDDLIKLAGNDIKVKATGFGRVNFNVANALKKLYAENHAALLFGTDLPSTRAPVQYTDDDFRLVVNTLGSSAAKDVFYTNAISFYRMKTLNDGSLKRN